MYEANVIAFSVECRSLRSAATLHAKGWLEANNTRIRIPEAKQLVNKITTTNSHDWWKDLREKIEADFAR